MKRLLRDAFAGTLATLARGVLKKYQPTVIMVTGSVGKTSTKDAVASVLSFRHYLRASEKSYNSEFGVPLTILGSKNPWARPDAWLKVFLSALALRFLPSHYPKLLVLEVGADRPGDLARILRIATPDAVVVTQLPPMPVHVEAYATPAAVREEEFAPAYALAPAAPLILSADDEYASALARPLDVEVLTYGFATNADVQLSDEAPYIEEGRVAGMEATISILGVVRKIRVAGALGRPQLLAPAAAIAAACALGMEHEEALTASLSYQPPAGRGRLIRGINNSILIDDSYNASPAAVEEALASLQIAAGAQTGGRRIAVLGDMLELGRYSQQEHERIGISAAKKCDVLVTVGMRSYAGAEAAVAAGLATEAVYSFDTSTEAAALLVGLVSSEDIVLIKGSQGVRMERIAEVLLENPKDTQLLVRQEGEWKRR